MRQFRFLFYSRRNGSAVEERVVMATTEAEARAMAGATLVDFLHSRFVEMDCITKVEST